MLTPQAGPHHTRCTSSRWPPAGPIRRKKEDSKAKAAAQLKGEAEARARIFFLSLDPRSGDWVCRTPLPSHPPRALWVLPEAGLWILRLFGTKRQTFIHSKIDRIEKIDRQKVVPRIPPNREVPPGEVGKTPGSQKKSLVWAQKVLQKEAEEFEAQVQALRARAGGSE